MTTPTNSDRLREIGERAAKATPGPWGWRGNVDNQEIFLCTLHSGWRFVLDCVRWGVRSAAFRFQGDGLMEKAQDLAIYEVCPGATERADKRVYRGNIVGIRHPDAEFIAASREDIPFLLSEINKLNTEKAETIEVLEELKTTESFGRWVVKRAEPLLDKLKGSPIASDDPWSDLMGSGRPDLYQPAPDQTKEGS